MASAAGSHYDFDGAIISRSDSFKVLAIYIEPLLLHTDHPWVTFVYRAVAVVSAPRHGRQPGSRIYLIICIIDKRPPVCLPQ